jgi:flagellar hook protein FlgE
MSVRSLLSGVSGLRNFQFQLDVVGNNIANSQTPGYKSSRVTFQDLLTQTIRGAVGPSATKGGTNPQEIGLGSSVGAIDTDLTQGNILNTGRLLDLAVQGEGFYKLTDGTNTFYSRAGSFAIDAAGNFVSTTTGYIVQGYNAVAGVLGSTVQGIQLPVGIVLPAQETTTVSLVGNLDSSSEQIGTILETDSLLGVELTASDNDMDGLYGNGALNGRVSGLQSGISTVTVATTLTAAQTYTYTTGTPGANEFNSLADLAAEINADFTAASFTAAVDTSGRLVFTSIAPNTVTLSSNNNSLNTSLASLNGALGAPGDTNLSDAFSHTAVGGDLLTNLRDSAGTSLGLAGGGTITINGNVGGTAVTPTTFTVGVNDLNYFTDRVTTAFDIGNSNNAEIVNGKVRITGDGGTDSSLSNLNLTASTAGVFDTVFDDTAGNYTSLQTAEDNYATSFIAYDSDGAAHTVSIKFNEREPSGGNFQWVWNMDSVETASGTADTFTGADSGTVTFAGDGSLATFSPPSVTITPAGGIATDIALVMSTGTAGGFDGLVSFENASSARFADITGYASGELQTITVNTEGIVTGNFTNGQNQTLAQLVLAKFDNPAGLSKAGQNLFRETINSGIGSDGAPGVGGRGSLVPSALEGSNVDLASEFINLITAQRGFQTNARVITTADNILGELVQIVR